MRVRSAQAASAWYRGACWQLALARRARAAAAALACRDPVPDCACAACAAAASAAAIIAAYFAAITELWISSGQIARHTVSRRPGRCSSTTP